MKKLEDILMTNNFEQEDLIKSLPCLNKFKDTKILTHTIKAIKNSEFDLEIRLALLFHDLGKLKAYNNINGKDTYHKHQIISEQIARSILSNHPIKNRVDLEIVYSLIREHMNKKEKTSTDKSITRLYNRVGEKAFYKLLKVFKADICGYDNINFNSYTNVLKKIEEWENKDRTIFKASEYYAINGHDLLELGFKGKELGRLLTYLQTLVDNNEIENKKEILLLKIQEYIDNVIK